MEETEDMLTAQEVDALLTAIDTGFQALGTDSVVDDAAFGAIPQEDTPVNPAYLFSGFPVDTTYACSEGGSIHLKGTIMPGIPDDATADKITINYDFAFVPSGCVATVEDAAFTLNSQAGMRQQGMVSVDVLDGDNAITLATTIINTSTGMVDWELDDRSGVCDMDLSTDARIEISLGAADSDADILPDSSIDVEGGTTGTLCGIEVERPAELPENGRWRRCRSCWSRHRSGASRRVTGKRGSPLPSDSAPNTDTSQ